jgi:succinate dehydrogenase / fumarate reductase flavoprotein subunit
MIRKFDAIVVGAGGSGLRAALELARSNLKVAVSPGVPDASHVAAQGGTPRRSPTRPGNWHWLL